MKTREDLLEYVKENQKKIPYFCNMPEEKIREFLETGRVDRFHVSEITGLKGTKEFRIESGVYEFDEETQMDEYFLTSLMGFRDDGTFSGTFYDTGVSFAIDDKGSVRLNLGNEEKNQLLEQLIQDKTIVTHFGDDLDNKSSIYAIENFLRDLGVLEHGENLKIERVRAGQVKEGFINIDTGGHTGNRVYKDTRTIVIDGDPKNGVKSACESLAKIGVYVPEQICELADARPAHVSPLDSRSGLALVRYLSGEQAFRLAESGLLDKTLTDEQLKEYGLSEAHLKQQQIIDTAVEKINKFTVELSGSKKIVLAPEQITAGSAIAYEMGIPYYASSSQHYDREGNPDGATFAFSCKAGEKLPKEIMEYGEKLVEQFRIDEKTSGVFISPKGDYIIAGGNKNPEFCIPGYTAESMLGELKSVLSLEKDFAARIEESATKRAELTKQNEQAKDLSKEYENMLSKEKSLDVDR